MATEDDRLATLLAFRAAHVLLSIEQYQRLIGQGRSIADLLAMPGGEDPELPLTHRMDQARPADLS